MTISNLITLIVGAYAAIVATTALVWNILREKRKVTVNIKYAVGFGGFKKAANVDNRSYK